MLNVKMSLLPTLLFGLALGLVPACGGGGGVADGTGQGLVLLAFSHSGVDNAVLNSRLTFRFSEAVDVATISTASIQVREGPSFGATVDGSFFVNGSVVTFEPRLAALCDQSDSGFKPDTQYRVQVIGFPEQFAIRNSVGQSLGDTSTYEFHTRLDNDPEKYADQVPGTGPSVVSTSPDNGSQAVPVVAGNRIEIVLSENIDPCTVDDTTVLLDMVEIGDPLMFATVANQTAKSGFFSAAANSTADQAQGDPDTWGADNTTSLAGDPQRVLAHIQLVQGFSSVRLVITPLYGYNPDPAKNASRFPENALLRVRLTFNILDYGGQPLEPYVFSFTTENQTVQNGQYLVENEGETPYIDALTTADVNTARAPGKAQGFMLFAGDGDNGTDQLSPSLPETPSSACTSPRQVNSGSTDAFDPTADVLLDTGSTVNTCPNATDNSNAVIWEFATFRVRNGVTVRIVGINPAIILVQGDVVIESGGRVLVRGDGTGGAPQGRGANAVAAYTNSSFLPRGGVGVAGGGDGGDATTKAAGENPWTYGQDGFSGYGTSDYDPTMSASGTGQGGEGAGQAGSPNGTSSSSQYNPWDGASDAGGGAGHATAGIDGGTKQGTVYVRKLAKRSAGGPVYGDDTNKMAQPEAGTGGGSAGTASMRTFQSSSSYGSPGGAGGAGGGFLDLTSNGDMLILGSIDAAGGRGGNGTIWNAYGASSGGGGGSGGGIRLLTPNDITLSDSSLITTAGGAGGNGATPYNNGGTPNHGGAGGLGRIALEDGDSVIAGLGTASVTPGEGSVGFYRGIFDASRFQGGGLEPQATSDVFAAGPFNPTFVEPVQNYGVQEDFRAGMPVIAAPGIGSTGILVEVRGYQARTDGTPEASSETDWFSVGSFKDTGVEQLPEWVPGHPGDISVPSDNAMDPASPHGNSGSGFAALNGTGAGGFEFIQFRFTMYLPNTVGPFDPGSFVDSWTIRFTADQ